MMDVGYKESGLIKVFVGVVKGIEIKQRKFDKVMSGKIIFLVNSREGITFRKVLRGYGNLLSQETVKT